MGLCSESVLGFWVWMSFRVEQVKSESEEVCGSVRVQR